MGVDLDDVVVRVGGIVDGGVGVRGAVVVVRVCGRSDRAGQEKVRVVGRLADEVVCGVGLAQAVGVGARKAENRWVVDVGQGVRRVVE